MINLITNISRFVTMEPGPGREGPLGVIKDAALIIENGRIKWFGPHSVPPPATKTSAGMLIKGRVREGLRTYDRTIDANGGVVLPGLIDCHTHLVHAGSRVDEFAARARGATYEEIARAGGGIMSTVRATREASENELYKLAAARAREAISYGVTTIEVKSGYGLDLENELKMLRVVKRLGKELPMEFVPTFLVHALPFVRGGLGWGRASTSPSPSLQRRGEYINLFINQMLPAVAKEDLAQFCDVFVENIAFTKEEARQILKAGLKYGLRPKLHVDQLTSGGGAELAASLKAVSADHLEYVSDKGISQMKKAGVVPVVLPGASFFMGKPYAPARKMIDRGLNVAIATDYNPGTSPTLNLWLMATIAVTQMKLTPDEALQGITINAARALAMDKTHGSVAIGKSADLVILKTQNEIEPFYRFDKSFVAKVIKRGGVIYECHCE